MAEEGENIPWEQVKADLGWVDNAPNLATPCSRSGAEETRSSGSARVRGAIALLAQDPRPPASRPLRGRPGYRVRVGDYRIIYTVADDVLLVVVVTLGHRRDVYEH